MRTLRFVVRDELLEQDPSCDFSGLFPGKNPDIRAEFVFSPEWNDRIKVIAFWSIMGSEYPPQLLDEDNCCRIPIEALMRPVFKLQVLGKRGKARFETNTISVYQKGGKS